MRRSMSLCLFAALLAGALPSSAAAHGGQYTGPNGPGLGSPRPGPSGSPRGGGVTSGTNPTWRNWWDRNREEFFHVSSRRAEKSGGQTGGQEGYDRAALHQPATPKDVQESILPLLVSALGDKSPDVRDAAAVAVGRAGQIPHLDALKPLLEDRNRQVREAAVMGVGLLRHTMSEQVLVELLRHPQTPYKERGMAAIALGLSGGKRAHEALLDRLGDANPFPRVSAVKTRQVDGCRALGIGLIGNTSDVAVLINAYKADKSKEANFRPMVLSALARLADPTSAELALKALRDRKNDVNRSAAILIGRVVRPEETKRVKKLIRLCKEERDKHTQYFLTLSLGRIGGDDAIAALQKICRVGRNREHRAVAAVALGMAKDTSSAPTLRKLLMREKDTSLRGAAAIALAILEDDQAGEIMLTVLNGTKNPDLRADLITGLSMLDYKKALPEIRKITARARNERLVRSCGLALAVMQDASSIELMISILKNKGSIQVKGGMATALGRTADRRAIEPLVKLVRDQSQTDQTRAFAVVALGLIGDKSPRSEFTRVSIDANYAMTNAEALLEVVDIF